MFWWLGFVPIISGICAVLCASQASTHHKQGVKIWRDTNFNPFNVLVKPSLLTPTGLKYRAASFFFVSLSIISVLALGCLSG